VPGGHEADTALPKGFGDEEVTTPDDPVYRLCTEPDEVFSK
jgi:hypothetical protein